MSGIFDHWMSDCKKKSGPIGIHFSGGNEDLPNASKNLEPEFFPDPSKYEIVKHLQMGKYLIVMINYPNCINYEGNKIMVYEDCTLKELKKNVYIDPHFFENKKFHSPIARFVPTDNGWEMAENLCKMLNK